MSEDATYGLALPFDRDTRDFALGVEIGRLWEQLKSGDRIEQYVHAQNIEMIVRLGEHTARPVRCEDTGDDAWLLVIFDEAPEGWAFPIEAAA